MFKNLQAKWKVNGARLFLILLTFALGGSLCGYAGRKILGVMAIDQRWIWILLYIILISLLWPVCVLLISIPLGQFGFFRKYIKKIGRRVGIGSAKSEVRSQRPEEGQKVGKTERPEESRKSEDRSQNTEVGSGKLEESSLAKSIAIFASGAGSNAEKIVQFAREGAGYAVDLVICNKPGAGVLQIAANHGINAKLITKADFEEPDSLLQFLKDRHIDFVVLAGFLWKIPEALIRAYPNRIINIHPALLPKFGGKGMYGKRVHAAVIAAGEKESGITIHYVDEQYDHGRSIFQAVCSVDEGETADSLAKKIHALEHVHYPLLVKKLTEDLIKKA